MSSLSILSWNVRGIMSSTISLCELLNLTNCDVAVICEHKLKCQTIQYLDTIDNNYLNVHRVSDDCGVNHYGKSGVAILYKRQLSFCIKEVDGIISDRIVGIELKTKSQGSVFIFSVYLPSDSSITEYRDTLNTINGIYTTYQQYGQIIFAGDFNGSYRRSDRNRCNVYKSNALTDFIDSNYTS